MPAVDFVEMAIEESPVYEGANTAATPYQISTDKLYLPARSAVLRPGPQYLDRSDELRGVLGSPPRLIDGFQVAGSLSIRAYPKDLAWLLSLAGFKGVFTAGGALVTDPDATTATGVNALDSTTVNVADTTLFAASGAFVMLATTVTYTGKTATSFTGCSAHPATVGGEAINVNVPTGASRWVFSKRDSIDAKTAQVKINYATEDVLVTANGVGLSSLGLNAAGELTAELLGLVFARAAADTTTVPAPIALTIPPFRRRDLTLTWLTSSGRTQDFTLAIANPLAAINTLGLTVPSFFPDAMEHGDDQVAVTGSIPKRILDTDDLVALLAGTTFSAKARWKETKVIGATAYTYSMWVEMPACMYVEGAPAEMGNKRRFGMDSLDFFAGYDTTAGYDVKVTLVNDVTSISAPHGQG